MPTDCKTRQTPRQPDFGCATLQGWRHPLSHKSQLGTLVASGELPQAAQQLMQARKSTFKSVKVMLCRYRKVSDADHVARDVHDLEAANAAWEVRR